MSIEEDNKQFIIDHIIFNKGKCSCNCSNCYFYKKNKKYNNMRLSCSFLTDEKKIEYSNTSGIQTLIELHRYDNVLMQEKIKKIRTILEN